MYALIVARFCGRGYGAGNEVDEEAPNVVQLVDSQSTDHIMTLEMRVDHADERLEFLDIDGNEFGLTSQNLA